MIVTARVANFPATIRKLELDVLDEDAATQFLLERTADDRQRAKDDEAQARVLARELGGLALGLEQAGAQIATDRIGFARYLTLWNENREKALGWSDPILTGSERTLATTWATSVARLSSESCRLFDRLAMLAPDPIPDSLLDVPVPGEAADYDAQKARAGLFAYSLVTRARAEGGQSFAIHRLVQDFGCRSMSKERRAAALRESLAWVNAAFRGAVDDVRSWPVLEPLAPHALAVVRRADEVGIAHPTGILFTNLGVLFNVKARFAESERLTRQAVAMGEATLQPNDPELATRLNNLAALLRDTNRSREAEPLYRRALAIDEASYGPDHPDVANRLNNLAGLLLATNRSGEATPLVRRALAILETSLGADHPDTVTARGNLAAIETARGKGS